MTSHAGQHRPPLLCAASFPAEQLHLERFRPAEKTFALNTPFEVVCARSGNHIAADETMLDARTYDREVITVCLPDEDAVSLLGAVPAGVELLVWDGAGDKPAGLERTEFWVPQVEDANDLPAKFSAMPQLQVVQLTSAGIEDIAGHVPEGVILCDARGVHGSAVAELPCS